MAASKAEKRAVQKVVSKAVMTVACLDVLRVEKKAESKAALMVEQMDV